MQACDKQSCAAPLPQVPNKSQAPLVNNLLHIGQPGTLFPDSSSIPVICPLTAPDSTTEAPGRVECRWQQTRPLLPEQTFFLCLSAVGESSTCSTELSS